MPRPTISVIIPALNEEENLPYVLPRIPNIVEEVILVDGNSTDRTIEVARTLIPDIRVITQEGIGKGAALRSGFAAAQGDIIVMLDADGSTAPEEIPLFVHALLAGADFAKGSRFLHGAGTSDMPFHRRFGNAVFVSIVRRLYGGHYTDLCYGYNAFWRRVLPLLDLDGDGFEIETMMNIRALRAGLRIVEVPSFEDRRVFGIGRLRTIPDGWRVLRTIWSERRTTVVTADAPARDGWDPLVFEPIVVQVNNTNGHRNGNVNGDAALDPVDFAELTPHDVGGNGYANGTFHAIPIDASPVTDRSTVWTATTNQYVQRLSRLIDGVDRAKIARVVDELRRARDRGATIFLAGNGGSSATAAHWVNDLGKATKASGQAPFRVMNLTDNVPWLTALGNDEGIDRVFAGQLENFGRPGDIVIVISASGNSPNILRLLETAEAIGMRKIGLVGFDGGAALQMLDEALWVETEHGAYGLVETTHTALADIVTTCLINDRVADRLGVADVAR